MKEKHLIFIWWNEPKWGRGQDRMRERRERLKIDWLQSVSKHFVYWCIYLLPTQAWRRQFCHSGTDVPCGLGSNVLWWMGSRWEGGHSSMLSASRLRLCWLSLRPGATSTSHPFWMQRKGSSRLLHLLLSASTSSESGTVEITSEDGLNLHLDMSVCLHFL